MATSIEAAVDSLRQIKSTEPPVWLVPKQELAQAVRAASKHLFSSLKPHSSKSPFDQLLIEGFDAEQIWQQIDLQSQPLLSTLRREVKKFEKNPEEISKLKEAIDGGKKKKAVEEKENADDDYEDEEDDDDIAMDEDDDDEEEEEEEDEEGKGKGSEEEGESESEGEERELEGEEKGGIEDKFLKIKELQEYLEEDEARELGVKKKKPKMDTKMDKEDSEEEEEEESEEEEEDEDDDEEEDELGLFDGDDEDDEDNLENARF